jgi:hypothetical protein
VLAAFYSKTSLPIKRMPAGPALPVCAVVTRADVEAATGRAVDDGSEEVEGRTSTCEYAAKGGVVSIAIQRLAGKPDLRLEIAAMQKEIPESVVRQATGFGEAFYLDVPGAGTQLHIVSGSSAHVMVSILGLGEAPEVAGAAAEIARKALKRL